MTVTTLIPRTMFQPGVRTAPSGRIRVSVGLLAVAGIGLALRVGWFAADPCVWWDEAWLILNVLDKSFTQLTGPLANHQAAPPVFLWSVKASTAIFGDGIYALRLVPFLASCVGFLLMFAVGGGYPRSAVIVAVVLLAGSSKMLSHTAEVKPYTLDFCVAAAVAVWFCRSANRLVISRIDMAMLVCPAVVLLVYPGCFLAGGVLLGLAIAARKRREWGHLVLAGLLTLAAFVLMLVGPAASQQTPMLREYWVVLGHFPNWSHPQSLPGWLLSGVGGIFRYCLYPLGVAFVPFAAFGFVSLWRQERRDVAVFLIGPFVLALGAGLLGRYPFGGSRLHLYAAPGLALLVAVSVRVMWDRLAAMDSWRSRIGHGILAGLVGWGLVEGAVFPLCESARLELRPASEFVKAHAHGETVIVGDHVSAYYLRHQSGVYLWNEVTVFPPGRVWVVGVFDQRVPDTVTPLLARGSRSVSRRDFGPITVFQLSASGCQE